MADFRSIYGRLPANGRWELAIRGANHFGFADFALVKSHVVLEAMRAVGVVGMDSGRQLEVGRWCVRSFFDEYLQTPPGPGIQMPAKAYPELQVVE